MFKVTVEAGSVFQNGAFVATVSSGWASARDGKFLIRSRKGNGEAVNFLKHMLKLMTVEELAAGVAQSSPVAFGAYHGWVMPHLKSWVKKGTISQAKVDDLLAHFAQEHAKKIGA